MRLAHESGYGIKGIRIRVLESAVSGRKNSNFKSVEIGGE